MWGCGLISPRWKYDAPQAAEIVVECVSPVEQCNSGETGATRNVQKYWSMYE